MNLMWWRGNRDLEMKLVVTLAALLPVAVACGGGGELFPTPTPIDSPSPTASPTSTFTPTPTAPSTPSPTCTPNTYSVEAGDVLSVLAERFNLTLDELMQANDIADPDLIFVGQELTIPCPEVQAKLESDAT